MGAKITLIALPPGAGKTRVTLNELKKLGKSHDLSTWPQLCKHILILGPNSRVERVWLRELALLNKIDREDEIRSWSVTLLRRNLHKRGIKVSFTTNSKLQKKVTQRFVVIDEWHHFNKNLGPLKDDSEQTIILVSATPMNPVMEQEGHDSIEDPKHDEDAIVECRRKTLTVIGGLLRINLTQDVLKLEFKSALQRLGVRWLQRKNDWIPPTVRTNALREMPKCIAESELRNKELIQIARFHDNSEYGGYSQEESWAIGLIRTQTNSNEHVLIKSKKGKPWKSFGFPYSMPFIVHKSQSKTAVSWLWNEHTRLKRLVNTLLNAGVLLKEQKTDKLTISEKEKALIFCTHQGVARGLTTALQKIVSIPSKSSIHCSLRDFDVKDNVEKDTSIHTNFMKNNIAPYILIATDKMSESIDLHGACRHVIHYELPWSPIRLLQRVGRLTRMRANMKFEPIFSHHVIIPGSVEEERVNRLIRRTKLLDDEGAWPRELYGREMSWEGIARSLIGSGPSLQFEEELL